MDAAPDAIPPEDAGPPTVAGLLLAAGAGRRMGRAKALVELGGETLAARGVRLLADGGCAPVVVVVGAAADEVGAALAALAAAGPRLVRAEGWAEGIGGSLRAGLEALAGTGAHAAVVTLVDQPGLTAAAVRRLIDAAAPAAAYRRYAALTATYRGRPGHPVLLRRAVWADVAGLARGEVGARAWLRAHPDAVGRVACDGLGTPADVDTPADLAGIGEDAPMDLSVTDNPERFRYEALTPTGEVAGFVQYQKRPDRIIFIHTEVSPEFSGQGVGSALATAALDDVRRQGLAVVPQCPYIRAFIERHPAYADLVAADA
ncbi:GNAT family N-acetyltransferase [Frankia sp. ACN1ag]|uniref:GNAT family N-acetyltransferase n=1 Tax=Frankia sp. ACN1ag TaxID=102891 RepID=UPI0006DBE5D2|nr:GNAT family N-acetyltransferase [Frankia sp. ACN1ag]KQC37052.1 molybdopterin-guanine dinucleotide biosynthesis protein MobA [Frankia sp. ACN1ag]